ncbi:hypothetical protein GN244_ATG01918 [Phytophthora infestans]|uniref:Uncharacterized protein n=1 Tax=Phytophthora infestans TaxID=4787 RepID=A0A833TM64_PHYIN|nr:hypothetical protein GN244_ATG01918 [Phytophthora infestans]
MLRSANLSKRNETTESKTIPRNKDKFRALNTDVTLPTDSFELMLTIYENSLVAAFADDLALL